jgi:tetratricopeptide (TPR) repeat protein
VPAHPQRSIASCVAAALAAAVALAGCRFAPSGGSSDGPGAATYRRDVAPILAEHCVSCHSPGGGAPFGLTNYAEVTRRASVIQSAVERRLMPPWLPEPGDIPFSGERMLSAAQIETIVRWIDQGAPEGSGEAPPPAAPPSREGWQLGEPDLVVRMPQPYAVSPAGPDIWRNFVVPIPVSSPRFVRTVELKPGSASFVHHALIGIDDSGGSKRRDAQDAAIGFDGMDMGDAYMPDGALLGWTPGMFPFAGLQGTAWRLDAGANAVLQIHMVPSGRPETLQAEIGFHFADASEAQRPAYVLQLDGDDQIDIPAGERQFVVRDALELPADVELHAVYPHAHFLGARVTGTATLPDGTTRSLLRIERWDFKWQDIYRYASPIVLPRGTIVSMEWTFDNSAENPRQVNHPPKRVTAGNRSSDEMAHLMLQVRPLRPLDVHAVKEAHLRHLVRRNPRNARFLWGLAGALKDQGRFEEAAARYREALASDPAHVSSRINLGAVLMALGQSDDAIRQFEAAVRLDPASAGGRYNLAFAFGAQGRLSEAARHYREAIRIRPDYAEAHNNLGQVLLATANVGEAVDHLREAARLLPGSADVHNNLGTGLLQQDRVDEAIAHFERAVALDASHADARQNLTAALSRKAR